MSTSLYKIYNPSRAARMVWDERGRQVSIGAGETKAVRLHYGSVNHAFSRGLVFAAVDESAPTTVTAPATKLPVIATPIAVRKSSLALVVGGSDQVREEYASAKAMCEDVSIPYLTLVVNDMIAKFPDRIDHAVTVHPQKLWRESPYWLTERESSGLSPPGEVWSHHADKKSDVVTRICKDHWGGNSGLFATKIAVLELHCRVILCGVPMTEKANHFIRGVPWDGCSTFTRYWNQHKNELAPHVRSMSGWTLELFGYPSRDFIIKN